MDIKQGAVEAVLAALADGAKSRNQLNKVRCPENVRPSVWRVAVSAAIDDLEADGIVEIREVPRPPIQKYATTTQATRRMSNGG